MDCLRSIQTQTMTSYECYVIDDGSDDGTQETVRAFANDDNRFHYIMLRGGAVNGRNAGFKRAKTDILVTFDDDVELVNPNTLAFIVQQFERDPNLGVLGLSEYFQGDRGRDGQGTGNTAPWRKVLMDTRFYPPGKINRWGWLGSRFLNLNWGEQHLVEHVRSSSMAIRRCAFEAVGGFYEPYATHGIGYRYETELCVRIHRLGYRNIYAAQHPQTYHKAAPRQRGWDRTDSDANYLIYTNRNNMFFFLRNYWHPLTAWIFFIWDSVVGGTPQPGVLRIITSHGSNGRHMIKHSLRGKLMGFKMYWQNRHDDAQRASFNTERSGTQ